MTPARKGDWMQTYTGLAYWPVDPHPDEVRIEDIAHALSLLCRYTGHCKRFYSVAEHSYYVSYLVPPRDALVGLLHDATEAYVTDIARPLKPHLANYKEIEARNWAAISEAYGLPLELPESVHKADNDILLCEQEQLMGPSPLPWGIRGDKPNVHIVGWDPELAERMFLARFDDLFQM